MFDERSLAAGLQGLPDLHRVAFAACCCERMLPNYAAFTIMEGWGQLETLRGYLNDIWAAVAGAKLEAREVEERDSGWESLAPDTEDFHSVFTSAALNAAVAITDTLRCCLGADPESVASIGGLAV